ncbi:MAG: hypothetical protein QM296_03810 [Bacillota bacterium]|nr:hypothetical protein [Bacillota bacterium]
MAAARRPGRLAATGGLLTALSILVMVAERLLPVGTLFSHLLLSILMLAAILLLDIKGAAAVWIATSVLAQLLLGPPISLVFTLVSGCYPLIKNALERRVERRMLCLVLKIPVAALLGTLLYLVARLVGLADPLIALAQRWPQLPWLWLAGPALLAAFIVYDLILDRARFVLGALLRQLGLLV